MLLLCMEACFAQGIFMFPDERSKANYHFRQREATPATKHSRHTITYQAMPQGIAHCAFPPAHSCSNLVNAAALGVQQAYGVGLGHAASSCWAQVCARWMLSPIQRITGTAKLLPSIL